MSKLVKVSNKRSAPIDKDSFLKWLWQSDSNRDWTFYSKEQSTHNWDIRTVEHRSK